MVWLWETGQRAQVRGVTLPLSLEVIEWVDRNPRPRNPQVLQVWAWCHSAASSGLGRRGGANVRSAAVGGDLSRSWVLGQSSGEDVEICVSPLALKEKRVDIGNLTIAKICYFFDHIGNSREEQDAWGPCTRWVVAYSYVTVGTGAKSLRDDFTQHPVYAIRRRVHMYHCCPIQGQWACGSKARLGG